MTSPLEPSSPPAIACGASTSTGRVRTENEDAMLTLPMVFAVADGMGGHQAGEVASALAVGTVGDRLSAGAESVDVVVAAVVEANAAIFQGAHRNAEQRGMGTTLTAMVVLTDSTATRRFAVINVGDSRTYLLRGERLRRITVDHSYVQELVSTGHITEFEARSHPRRNIVTRALGIEPSVRVDTWVRPLVSGDRYVLCSDGLVDEVDDDEITSILLSHPDPQSAADALVEAANTNGGRDNTTVVVLDVLEGDSPPDDTTDIDVSWNVDLDDDVAHERLIDAEAATAPPQPEIRLAATPSRATKPMSSDVPAVASARRGPRFGLGALLSAIAFGVIAMLTIVFVLVVRDNAVNDSPTTTITSTTTPATTTAPPATTIATTTIPTTTIPTTTTPGP